MSTLEEILSVQSSGDGYDFGDVQFIIDEDLRTITVPARGTVIGAEHDNDVNHVNFRIVRYYNSIDLSEFNFAINYINAEDLQGYYVVTNKLVTDDYIYFDWLVSGMVTTVAGTVQFSIRVYDGNGRVLNSTIATGQVRKSLSPDDAVSIPTHDSIIEQIQTMAQNAGAEVVASVEETGETIRTDLQSNYPMVSEMKTALANFSVGRDIDIYTLKTSSYPYGYRAGTYNETTGLSSSSGSWIRTNSALPIPDGVTKFTVTPSSGHAACIVWFSSAPSTSNNADNSSIFVSGKKITTATEITVVANALCYVTANVTWSNSAVSDPTLIPRITYTPQVIQNGTEIDEIRQDIVDIHGIVGGKTTIHQTAYIEKFYKVDESTNRVYPVESSTYYSTLPIDISAFKVGTAIKLKTTLSTNYGAFLCDTNMLALDYINGNNAVERGYTVSTTPIEVTFTMVSGAKYIVADIRNAVYTDISLFDVTGTIDNLYTLRQYTDNSIAGAVKKTTVHGKNLLDETQMTAGILNAQGAVTTYNGYKTSDYIYVASGQSVYISPRIRQFIAYTTDKTVIAGTFVNTATIGYSYTATQNCYIRATMFDVDSDKQIEYGSSATSYEAYYTEKVCDSDFHLTDTQIADSGNILYGKKWVACGDSFTEGAFANSTTNAYLFTDGKYKGKNKVYPYWIGYRNRGLTVINEAVSGSTMTGGSSGTNGFSVSRYREIPADADYITLRFGINDSGHSCPIGTISDATNETFYGAWNVVLDYLTTNYPFAHIGIIVGEGMQTEAGQQYANAEIAVAKKWGIPYLNIQFESGGEKIPLTLRTSNPNVSPDLIAKKFNAFAVNTSTATPNHHPNEKAHEYESHFIEAWLRTL